MATTRGRPGGMIPTRYQFPRMVEETHGPWVGVRDGPASTEGDPEHAQQFRNCYIADPGQGGAVLARPGFQILTAPSAPLGTAANRYPQGIACYNPAGGTTLPGGGGVLYAFVGGRMFEIGNLGSLNLSLDVTPAGVTISPNAPYVWAVNYAGKLIVSDGINSPWTWDGTTATYIDWDGSGTRSHSVAYGPPTVYYDQLFFVCNTGSVGNRTTLIWSEPNNPALGYIQTVSGFTYADTWTLAQTGSEDIQCILGTNTALYYWRGSSMGALYGSPALNFASTATHDAVSLTTGTLAAKCVVPTDREIYFLDQGGKPHVLEYGGFLTPMWQDSQVTFGAASQAMFPPNVTQQISLAAPSDQGSGCYDDNTKCIYWSVSSGTLATNPPTIYAFDTRTKKYYGQWTHSSLVAPTIGMFQVTGVPNVAGGLGAYPASIVVHLDFLGNLYILQAQANALPAGNGIDQVTWLSPGRRVNYAIENSVQASQMLYDAWAETTFDRVEWSTVPFTFCNLTLDYQSPRSTTFSTALALIQPLTATSLRSEITVGVNLTARTILPRITNQPGVSPAGGLPQNLNALGLVQVKLRGYRVDMNPGSP